jgi:F-type H+-transporting ATPase subunit gamma
MASAQDIRSQIRSTKNTQKITSAMELVAASKMRKAQDRMKRSKPYATKIRQVIKHIAGSNSEYHHPFLDVRPIDRVGILVVTTDRGLCGGLNINLMKKILEKINIWNKAKISVEMCTIGIKGQTFLKRIGGNIIAHADHIGDAPELNQLIGIVKILLDAFSQGKLDAVYICSNEFINSMVQTPQIEQLLPIVTPDAIEESTGAKEKKRDYWDYLYEPEAKIILDKVLSRYVESQVYQAVVENLACEQSARMVAMKSASENAEEIIGDLQLAYNKARQAAITREISEIVSGADAVK